MSDPPQLGNGAIHTGCPGRSTNQSNPSVLTADLQLTLHGVLSAGVHGLARVHSPIKWTRLTDLQRQDAVVTEHPVLGFVGQVHLVFVPGHFGLTGPKRVSRSSEDWNRFSSERGERPQRTDLWHAPDGAAEGGVVSRYNRAVHERPRELGSLRQVGVLVGGRFVDRA